MSTLPLNEIDQFLSCYSVIESDPIEENPPKPTPLLKFQATQIGCGQFQIDRKLVDLFVSRLNQSESSKGVRFKFSHESTSQLSGICSAMAIKFLALCVFKGSVTESTIQSLQTCTSRPTSIDVHIQSAFDRIEKYGPELSSTVFRKVKVEALLSGFRLKVADAFQEIDLNNPFHFERFSSIIDGIPSGFYFIRSLFATANEKGEYHGHSTAFVKQEDRLYFYDPNLGAIEFESDLAIDTLYSKAMENHKIFNIPILRIYKVEENEKATFSFNRIWQSYQTEKLQTMIANLGKSF